MKINALEKGIAALLLVTASTTVLSSLSGNQGALALQVQGLVVTQEKTVFTHVRGLSDPQRSTAQYLAKDRSGKVVKIDPSSVIEKGTMQTARSDSYQSALYLSARDAQR